MTEANQGIENWLFLRNALTAKAENDILDCIARHYGITRQEAWKEVVCDEAEHLLEYLTGAERAAASVLMQKNGFAVTRGATPGYDSHWGSRALETNSYYV